MVQAASSPTRRADRCILRPQANPSVHSISNGLFLCAAIRSHRSGWYGGPPALLFSHLEAARSDPPLGDFGCSAEVESRTPVRGHRSTFGTESLLFLVHPICSMDEVLAHWWRSSWTEGRSLAHRFVGDRSMLDSRGNVRLQGASSRTGMAA